jgi:hypothetical protein
MPTPRLPTPGGDANSWGSVLNDYLQQALASDGTLVTSSTNSYTGLANTNLANGSRPGLIQLAGDLGNTAVSPTVAGLQGRSVDSGAPSDGNVLTWSASGTKWQPQAPIAYTAGTGLGLASNQFSLSTPVSVGNGGTGAGTLTGIVKGNGTSAFTAVTAPSGTIVGTSDTQTLTNKRSTARVGSTTSSATPAINTDSFDIYNITALAANITSMTTSLSGTPNDGDKLIVRIKDNGTGRTIAWGASFASSGVATLLATTVAGKQHTVGLIYSSGAAAWICLAVDATGY